MPSSPLKVAIVEDQQLFRELLTNYIESVPDMEVVGAAGSVEQARELFENFIPNVVIMDIDLPDGNGVGLAASLKRAHPFLGVLLLSEKDLLELVRTLPREVQRGISYLAKSSTTDLDMLTSTIRSTSKGFSVIDPKLTIRSAAKPGTGVASLTPRQFEILRLLATGKSTEAMAKELGLAQNSVVNTLTTIYNALNIPEDANARVYAVLQFLADTSHESY